MTRHDHLDHRLPPEVRADLLAREMTVVEKCYQLTAVPPWWLAICDGSDPDGVEDLLAKAPGHVCNFAADDPARMAQLVGQSRRVKFLVAATQLGYTNLARDFSIEPARVEVYLGLDSHDRHLEGAFELTGDPRLLASGDRSFFYEVGVSDV